MKTNSRQHYVPRFYLRGWCDAKDYIWAFPIGEKKPPFHVSVDNVACEKGLYSHPQEDQKEPLATEKIMAKIESLYATKWPNVCDDAGHPETRMNIARFLALLVVRHPEHVDQVRRINETMLSLVEGMADNEEIKMEIQGKSGSFTAKEIRHGASREKDSVKSAFLRLIPALIEDLAKVLSSRKWGLVFSENPTFVTSDCPLSLHRGKATKRAIGFRTPGTQILFPISPVRLLAISDDWPHPFAHYKLARADVFNKPTSKGAKRFVFFNANDEVLNSKIQDWRGALR